MIHLCDAAVDAALAHVDVAATLREAFIDFARGDAAMQPRVRIDCAGVRLSTLGAIWPARQVAGAKIYTTIAGRFSFAIVLFSSATGEVLATLDANAITRRRTAAVSLLAARAFARPDARTLAVFGAGTQARAHLEAFADGFALREVRLVVRQDAQAHARALSDVAHCDVHAMQAREALRGADLVITATRAVHPLFDGNLLESGAFVAAVGSSKPDARELDGVALRRARTIVVEWCDQTLREAGEFVLCEAQTLEHALIVELGCALADPQRFRRSPDDIVIFKSVGVGLADLATAELAYRHAQSTRARAA